VHLDDLSCAHFGPCSGCTLEHGLWVPPIVSEAQRFFASRGFEGFSVQQGQQPLLSSLVGVYLGASPDDTFIGSSSTGPLHKQRLSLVLGAAMCVHPPPTHTHTAAAGSDGLTVADVCSTAESPWQSVHMLNPSLHALACRTHSCLALQSQGSSPECSTHPTHCKAHHTRTNAAAHLSTSNTFLSCPPPCPRLSPYCFACACRPRSGLALQSQAGSAGNSRCPPHRPL
jgi:hypothetical protein